MGDLSTSLRALAHPGSVLALVVLVLNDHLLKQAWPGWVTGKLSDVAGLVVFPLLLAVPLTALRVRRSLPVALVVAGGGFVFCKTSAWGAAWTSSLWSLFGTPTMMRADVTDLLTLPALWIAWRIHRSAAHAVGAGWRRTVAVAVGAALLPVGVLATSATSCQTDDGISDVEAVRGRFTGAGQRAFFVVDDRFADGVKMDPVTATVSSFSAQDRAGLVQPDAFGSVACDRTGMTCWRIEGQLPEDRVLEMSQDGGVTWATDLAVSKDDQERSVEGVDPGCGDEPAAWLLGLAVLDTDAGVTVAVTAKHAGVWLRSPQGSWRLVPRDSLELDVGSGSGPQDDHDPRPAGPVRGRLFVVYVPPARSDEGWREATPSPAPEPQLPCASPTQRTVTPNPSNGPPTTYPACP
jgi:hypothetical protein